MRRMALAGALAALALSAAQAQESPPEPAPATVPPESGGAVPPGLATLPTPLPTTLPTTLAGAAGTWRAT